jgi:hypothetical protein
MIDRVASHMLGEIPWPPTGRQTVNIGIALAEVGAAMWLWSLAARGKTLSLSPWKLRAAAVLSGAAALWAIYHVRATSATQAMPAPQQTPAVDWRYAV